MSERDMLPRDQLVSLLAQCGYNPKSHNNSTLRMVIRAAEKRVVADSLRITELEGDVAYLRQIKSAWERMPRPRMIWYGMTGRREI